MKRKQALSSLLPLELTQDWSVCSPGSSSSEDRVESISVLDNGINSSASSLPPPPCSQRHTPRGRRRHVRQHTPLLLAAPRLIQKCHWLHVRLAAFPKDNSTSPLSLHPITERSDPTPGSTISSTLAGRCPPFSTPSPTATPLTSLTDPSNTPTPCPTNPSIPTSTKTPPWAPASAA